jgi:hypothetical protein
MTTVKTSRPIYEIANEIKKDWKKIYFGAVPYLDAMETLTTPTDKYGFESGKSIINYFLANAGTWRGDKAKAIKSELKAIVK